MTNIGIIGCGNIARFHHEGYAKAGARIIHVCDARREAADAVGARYGATVSTDWRAVLDDPRVQLVSILLPASLHKAVSLAAIAAGKGVVCEKTLTDTPADSAEVARAAEQAGVFFATAYMKRFFPAAQQMKALLADMGPITSLYARTWQPFDVLWDTPAPPEYTTRPSPIVRNYGGGVLVCGGSHILDLIHWIGGRPTQVCGQMRSRPEFDFDIQANAMLWLPEGGLVHFEAQWHPLRFAGYERNGWDERLEVNTPAGRLDFYTVKWDAPEKKRRPARAPGCPHRPDDGISLSGDQPIPHRDGRDAAALRGRRAGHPVGLGRLCGGRIDRRDHSQRATGRGNAADALAGSTLSTARLRCR